MKINLTIKNDILERLLSQKGICASNISPLLVEMKKETKSFILNNKRQLKKNIKNALEQISASLNIREWNVDFIIDETYNVAISIIVESKDKSVLGKLLFGEDKEQFEDITFDQNKYKILNNVFTEKRLKPYLVVNILNPLFDSFIIGHPEKKQAENKINNALFDHQEKIKKFFVDFENKGYFSLKENNIDGIEQKFYISDEILWRAELNTIRTALCSKTLRVKVFLRQGDSNIYNISDFSEKTFIRSLIDLKLININADIEEVMTWDIQDIFEMSKLIGY